MSESCKACRFFRADDKACRRYPPQIVTSTRGGSMFGDVSVRSSFSMVFPVTGADDWCGEFEAAAVTAEREDGRWL